MKENTNKTSHKNIKRIFIVLIIAILLVVILLLIRRIPSSETIAYNPEGWVGNTAGNLYNEGLFYETLGAVYFSNPYDNGCLYCFDRETNTISKMTAFSVSHINGGGDYLYFYTETDSGNAGLGYVRGGRGIYRYDILEGDFTFLTLTTTDSLLLYENTLYYTDITENENDTQEALIQVNQISTSGGEASTIFREHIKLGSVNNGQLYYAGMEQNHFLHSYEPSTGVFYTVCQENMYLPIFSEGYIYYLDLREDYHLKRYSLYDESITTLVATRIDTYNLYNGILYYQTCVANDYQLRRVYTDGTGDELVREGVYQNINITSDYVYFTEFGQEVPVYRTSTFGAVDVRTFDSARDAAFQNTQPENE